jgi:hypothetical protein
VVEDGEGVGGARGIDRGIRDLEEGDHRDLRITGGDWEADRERARKERSAVLGVALMV